VLRALRRELPGVEMPAEIARLLPEIRGGALRATPDETFPLFDAIHRYAGAVANERPLLVVLEDLHAADVASLQLLAFFASHLPGSAIAVVGTYRTSEARTTPDVGALIARLGRDAETIVPRRLGRDDIAALAAEGGVTAPSMIDAIERASEGNPLFASELVKLIGRTGAIAIPDSVRDAIREHVARLPAAARVVAEHAAVLGSELPRG
jgi:predicted ATPase